MKTRDNDPSLKGWKEQLIALEGVRSFWKWRLTLEGDCKVEGGEEILRRVNLNIEMYKEVIAKREAEYDSTENT